MVVPVASRSMPTVPRLLAAASSLYGFVAGRRRAWYSRPDRQRHLRQPVISVGNLSVGGSGKTPTVAHLAGLLLSAGERPAILSRGYGRRVNAPGVTVVSDGSRTLADVDHAGDEPLMLARMLPGVAVLVAKARYAAGCYAEAHLGATVHLLDDGYQHLQLARDIDLLLLDAGDLSDRVLPAGRLREPLAAAAAADALLIRGAGLDGDSALAAPPGALDPWRLAPSSKRFTVRHALQPLQRWPSGAELPVDSGRPVLAVAGIARPERLFADLNAAGWRLSGTLVFPDHHRYSPADVARIAGAARDSGAALVVTTAKDAVRLERLDLGTLSIAVAPITSRIEPAAAFADWLTQRLIQARQGTTGVALPSEAPRPGPPERHR